MNEAEFLQRLEVELDKLEASASKIRKLIERRVASQPELFPTKEPEPKRPRIRRQRPIPTDWWPEPDVMAQLAEQFPGINIEGEAHAHKDYWTSKGQHRSDWDASFRNWLRLAATRYRPDARTAGSANGIRSPADKVTAVSQYNSDRARGALARLHQIRGKE